MHRNLRGQGAIDNPVGLPGGFTPGMLRAPPGLGTADRLDHLNGEACAPAGMQGANSAAEAS
jgi:hypothetical protein